MDKLSFFDKALLFFKKINCTVICFLKKNYITLLSLIALSITAVVAGRFGSMIYQEKVISASVEEFAELQSEKMIDFVPGINFESNEGLFDSYRLYGNDKTYQMYVRQGKDNTIHIYDEKSKEWVQNGLDIPPIVSQAFIYYDIGIVDEFDGKTAIVGEKEFSVDYSPTRVRIDGHGLYAPLPPIHQRVEEFLIEYTGMNKDAFELIDIERGSRNERLYIEDKEQEKQYELKIYFNKSAEIGRVESGIEKIKENIVK